MTELLENDMRYYHEEHTSAYRAIEERGYTQWNDLFDDTWTYDHFQNRAFLERILLQLDLPEPSGTSVLEYGCGTGPAACFLAGLGFQVDAVDLIPEAIAIGQRMATQRGVHVTFGVADICDLASAPVMKHYDVVLDSYCLQSIVTDEDRHAVFAAVRTRLRPDGYYLISTALYELARVYAHETYDASTGICYREAPAGADPEQMVEIDGRPHIPHRRHLPADALRDELAGAGFDVLDLADPEAGNVVCRVKR